jgi:hypothetical protein
MKFIARKSILDMNEKISWGALLLVHSCLCGLQLSAQSGGSSMQEGAMISSDSINRVFEFRFYNLRPGSRPLFHQLFLDSCLPLLNKYHIDVVTFGGALQDENTYFLIRSYKDLQGMQIAEDALYGSQDWKKSLRERVLSQIVNYSTVIFSRNAMNDLINTFNHMQSLTTNQIDSTQLSALNAQFIRNFLAGDADAHSQIIYKDFDCIEGDGSIVDRQTYLKNWPTAYRRSGYTSFSYSEESIKIFGNLALVRCRTSFTKIKDGQTISGHSVYTDTYLKEKDRWWCIQAQITPCKLPG